MKNNKTITEGLNKLLSDYQIFYQNVRGLHWNVEGRFFLGLHELYEKLYNETAEVIDELAERIVMLGEVPFHSFADYINNAQIKVVTNVSNGEQGMKIVLDDSRYLLENIKNLFSKASDLNDESTASLLSDLISSTEKRIWMLSATLK